MVFLRGELYRFSERCDLNGMPLNASQCVSISFHRSRTLLSLSAQCVGATLESVSKVRDLGIIISTVLSFNARADAVYYDGKSHRVLRFL